jgi:cell division protein FtsZ
MGIGVATGENRAVEAAKQAINSNLLDMSIDGARGIVFTVTGGPELSMSEVNEAAKIITAAADEEAKIIFGAVIDDKMKDEIKITVVATGFDGSSQNRKSEIVKPVYTPNPFIAEKESEREKTTGDDRNKSKFSSVFKNLPMKSVADSKKVDKPEDEADDDLSVPAFIRKKMG